MSRFAGGSGHICASRGIVARLLSPHAGYASRQAQEKADDHHDDKDPQYRQNRVHR